MNTLIAISYSVSQDAYHTELLEDHCRINAEDLVKKQWRNDYKLVATAASTKDADAVIEKLRKLQMH
jgi:hypothetical protein